MSDPIVVGAGKKAGDQKRLFVMVGVGVALLLIVLVLPKLSGGGGGGAQDDTTGLGAPVAGATATTVPAKTGTGTAAVKSTKNPFVPLVAAVGSSGAPAGMDASNTTVVNPVDAGSGSGTGSGTTDPTAGGGSTPSGPAATGIRLGLVEVLDSGAAIVRVNDETYQVVVDDVFAGSFRLSSTDVASRCGTVVYGDRRVALCEGEEAVV